MRIDRLVIEHPTSPVSLTPHAGLTVIGSLDADARATLAREVFGALGAGRPGVHVEVTTSSGARLAIVRPVGAPHLVIDVAGHTDVSEQFRDANGSVDILGRLGLTPNDAAASARAGAEELAVPTGLDERIRHLARRNQRELWPAAEAVRAADAALAGERMSVEANAADQAEVDRLEQECRAYELAIATAEESRRNTFLIAAVSSLSTIGVAPLLGVAGIIATTVIALAAVVASLGFRQRYSVERQREEELLAAAGAHSSLGFQLQRVNSLLAAEQERRRLLAAKEELRVTSHHWSMIAGTVPWAWALEHRSEIESTHTLLRSRAGHGRPEDRGNLAADVAESLSARLQSVRTLGTGGEGLPVILDEPFTGLSDAEKGPLLEMLVQAATEQQVILLTADPWIESWARLEAMTGPVAAIDAAPVRHIVTA